jgi:ABC-2 type transport system ATP-binding protein
MIAALQETSRLGTQRVGAPVVARLEGVSKNYGAVQALRNVDFAVTAGELVALLGPNGAGKTTAIKLLLGIGQAGRGAGDGLRRKSR